VKKCKEGRKGLKGRGIGIWGEGGRGGIGGKKEGRGGRWRVRKKGEEEQRGGKERQSEESGGDKGRGAESRSACPLLNRLAHKTGRWGDIVEKVKGKTRGGDGERRPKKQRSKMTPIGKGETQREDYISFAVNTRKLKLWFEFANVESQVVGPFKRDGD